MASTTIPRIGALIQLRKHNPRWAPEINGGDVLFVVDYVKPWYEILVKETGEDTLTLHRLRSTGKGADSPEIGVLTCLLPNGKLHYVRDWYLDGDFLIL